MFPLHASYQTSMKKCRIIQLLRSLDSSEDLEMLRNMYLRHFSGLNTIPLCVLTSVSTNQTLLPPQSSHIFQYKHFIVDTTPINFQHQYLHFLLHFEKNGLLFLHLPEATLEWIQQNSMLNYFS